MATNHGNAGRKQSPEHIARRVESYRKTRQAWSEEKQRAFSDKVSLAIKARPKELQEKFMYSNIGREPWSKGKKCPQLSGKNHWNWGNKMPQESIEKMRKSLTGKQQSKETIVKRVAIRAGYSHSPETKAKIGLANSGDKNGNWEGGISHEEYPAEFWRKCFKDMVRDRDNRICQICGTPEMGKALDIHHIDYDKRNVNPENLVSLCHKCHGKTNFNREQWQEYFNQQNNISLTKTNI